MRVPGFDSSFDELTEDKADRLWVNEGMRVFMQCLWDGVKAPAVRETNLRRAKARGYLTGGYISLTASKTGQEHVRLAFSDYSPDTLLPLLWKVAIDVELGGITLTQCLQAWEALVVGGFSKVLYSNFDTVVNKMGNPLFPGDVELWDADWNVLEWYKRSYGGFGLDRVIGWQYKGNATPEGQTADLDMFEVPNPPTQQDYPQNKIDLARGILGDKYLIERLPDNQIGEKVFVAHLAAGGDPVPFVELSV